MAKLDKTKFYYEVPFARVKMEDLSLANEDMIDWKRRVIYVEATPGMQVPEGIDAIAAQEIENKAKQPPMDETPGDADLDWV